MHIIPLNPTRRSHAVMMICPFSDCRSRTRLNAIRDDKWVFWQFRWGFSHIRNTFSPPMVCLNLRIWNTKLTTEHWGCLSRPCSNCVHYVKCRIEGEEYNLLGCVIMQCDISLPAFRKKVFPIAAGSHGLLYDLEDEDSSILRTIGKSLQYYMMP